MPATGKTRQQDGRRIIVKRGMTAAPATTSSATGTAAKDVESHDGVTEDVDGDGEEDRDGDDDDDDGSHDDEGSRQQQENRQSSSSSSHLSAAQAEAVDRAFEELFGYRWGTVFALKSKVCDDKEDDHDHDQYDKKRKLSDEGIPSPHPRKLRRSRRLRNRERLLCEILSPKAAARILHSYRLEENDRDDDDDDDDIEGDVLVSTTDYRRQISAVSGGGDDDAPRNNTKPRRVPSSDTDAAVAVTTIGAAAAPHRPEPAPVAPSAASNSNTNAADANDGDSGGGGGRGGMDHLLSVMTSSNKVTTVAKTSADWDNFKDRSGLGDKLEQHAESKESYLKRQDFLSRVDLRRFEQERQERERNRLRQQQQQQQQR